MYPRLLTAPKGSFFLFGARGTGKSTWARAQFSKAARIDFLNESTYQDQLRNPQVFTDRLAREPEGAWIVVDEVQRLPSLLNEVHRAIEERGQRFVLLGSSARKLRRAGTNLLGGRASLRTIGPFLPEELGADFDLDRVLRHGSLPIVWTSEEPEDALRAYVRVYLREEIQAEAVVRDLGSFARFLPVAGVLNGQALNVSGIAREVGVARSTVTGFLEILEDTLLAWTMPAWEAKLRVRERSHPKLYWVDPGLARAARGSFGSVAPEEAGALFEGWIANLLRTYGEKTHAWGEVRFWAATESRREIDFILTSEDGARHVAIETKAGSDYDTSSFRGLRAVGEADGMIRRILLVRGLRADARTRDGIDILTVPTFLAELAAGTLFAPAA